MENQNSPFSISASIAGISTSVYALATGLFFYIQAIKDSGFELVVGQLSDSTHHYQSAAQRLPEEGLPLDP